MKHVVNSAIGVIIVSFWMIHARCFDLKNRIQCNDDVVGTGAEQFTWKYNKNAATAYAASTSANLCWEEGNESVVIRKCDFDTGRWSPINVSCSQRVYENVFCPDKLIEIPLDDNNDYICISVSERKQRYNGRTCYGADSLPLADYIPKRAMTSLTRYLTRNRIGKFWLPVRKADDNPYSPFIIRLPGIYWGQPFPRPVSVRDLLSDKHCLSATYGDDQQWSVELTHCDEEVHTVCVFHEHFVTVSGCPQGFGALSYHPTKCYGIEWVAGLFPLDLYPIFLADYYERRNALRLILHKKDIDQHRFFLMDRFDGFPGDNQRYAIEMNVQEELHAVAIQDDERKAGLSWELLKNRKSVQMGLKMESGELILTVYNRYYIWRLGTDDNLGIKCFTNAQHELWQKVDYKKIWQNELGTKTMFQLKMAGDGPGYYWCEAHTVFDFGLVTTNKLVAQKRQKGHTFAVTLNTICDEPVSSNVYQNMKALSKKVKDKLKNAKHIRKLQDAEFSHFSINDVRIMKIISVTNGTQVALECIVHVTVSLKSSAVDNSSEQSSEEEDSEENVPGIRHDTMIRMKLKALLTDLISADHPHGIVNSIEFCFPEHFQMDNLMENQWLQAQLGQSSTTLQLCLGRSGLPVTRKCEGDFVEGAQWQKLNYSKMSCITESYENIITQSLYELELSKVYKKYPHKAMKNVKKLLESHISNLIPADFYYMAKIIQNTVKRLVSPSFNNITGGNGTSALLGNRTDVQLNPNDETTGDIVRIYNYLMEVNKSIIKPSIVLNATNILLDAFENLMDKISMPAQFTYKELKVLSSNVSTTIEPTVLSTSTRAPLVKSSDMIDERDRYLENTEYVEIGVVVKLTRNLVVFVIDPSAANITGIALFNEDFEEEHSDDLDDYMKVGAMRGAFKDIYYRFILANQTVDDLLYESNMEMATYVPDTLLQRLDEISLISNNRIVLEDRPATRIVVKIYANDNLFQEEERKNQRVWGKIVSVSIPGHDKDLPELLPLILRVNNDSSSLDSNNTIQSCSYWNYKTWVNDGLTYLGRSKIDPEVILCGCSHLTPFAYLIGGVENVNVVELNTPIDYDLTHTTQIHNEALDIITLLGCSLSLLGILGIIVTAFTFQSWRQKASSKVLLQLSTAIAFQMILFCFVNTEEASQHLIEHKIFSSCIAMGALLHYSVLVQFSWMVIIAYLQFKRYVQVFGNSRPKRFFIKSTLFGWGVPLVPVLLVIVFDSNSYIPSADSSGSSICYPSGYALYFGVVLPVITVIVANLIIFVIVVYNILRGPDGSIRHTEKRLALSQIRLSILLFFLLGFTWIFGLLTTMRAGLVFSYLFCLTATLQGFVIFVYFIVLDPVTRRLWGGYFQATFGLRTSYESPSTSVKETTQTQ